MRLEREVAALKRGLMTAITGYEWDQVLTQNFDNEETAFKFEQLVHNRLHDNLVDNEREVYAISYSQVQSVWVDVLNNANWAL